MLPWYIDNKGEGIVEDFVSIQRVQTGMRIEKRILKVLKALAEYLDMSLGGLIEGIVLHAFEGKVPFDQFLLEKIEAMKKVYELDLTSEHSHKLTEARTDQEKAEGEKP